MLKIKCSQCQEFKNEEFFSKNKCKSTGRQGICKKCQNELRRKKYSPEDRRKKYKENKERDLNQAKLWRKNNIDKYRKYQRKWANYRRSTDSSYALLHRLRNRLLIGIKHQKKVKLAKFFDLTGCSSEELKTHIESKFTKGMTWELLLKGKIVIDHIKPCCSFDFSKLEDQKACFHYSNLRPLWKEDNQKKISDDLKRRLIRD